MTAYKAPPPIWDTQPNYMQLHGDRLVDNGFAVVPIQSGTKKPGRWSKTSGSDIKDWQNFAFTKPTTSHPGIWKNWPSAGVGVVCGDICAVDIDSPAAAVAGTGEGA